MLTPVLSFVYKGRKCLGQATTLYFIYILRPETGSDVSFHLPRRILHGRRYSHTSVLTGFGTRQTSSHFDEKKKMFQHSALARDLLRSLGTCRACLGLAALARICMSRDAAPQEKMLRCSELVGVGTGLELQNKLTMSTEVPLYLK